MTATTEQARTERLFDLMWLLLEEPRRWTRKRLAAHYGLSERQITKDLATLERGMRCPIVHSRQGYYFDNDLRICVPYRPRDAM